MKYLLLLILIAPTMLFAEEQSANKPQPTENIQTDYLGANLLSDIYTFKRVKETGKGSLQEAIVFGKLPAYIRALSEFSAVIQDVGGMNNKYNFCIPPKTPLDDLISVLKDGLEMNPHQHQKPAIFFAITAFHEAYPCPEPKKIDK
ncbi:hypothetical protein A7981_08470 [Methylovorus sp. MM2]|uniref:Rap1a/Tai family immunity protein n=1 Tax=Methylovorus sp. MM2 TaxID=1848038 RepID=UPI0007DFCE84|nr:Rap1a/Tai family immunity protein [Methylovorus sp. MM2]OAM51514.1 hypothetical protein A7981_08470 [Methylovorus sp. MM2]